MRLVAIVGPYTPGIRIVVVGEQQQQSQTTSVCRRLVIQNVTYIVDAVQADTNDMDMSSTWVCWGRPQLQGKGLFSGVSLPNYTDLLLVHKTRAFENGKVVGLAQVPVSSWDEAMEYVNTPALCYIGDQTVILLGNDNTDATALQGLDLRQATLVCFLDHADTAASLLERAQAVQRAHTSPSRLQNTDAGDSRSEELLGLLDTLSCGGTSNILEEDPTPSRTLRHFVSMDAYPTSPTMDAFPTSPTMVPPSTSNRSLVVPTEYILCAGTVDFAVLLEPYLGDGTGLLSAQSQNGTDLFCPSPFPIPGRCTQLEVDLDQAVDRMKATAAVYTLGTRDQIVQITYQTAPSGSLVVRATSQSDLQRLIQELPMETDPSVRESRALILSPNVTSRVLVLSPEPVVKSTHSPVKDQTLMVSQPHLELRLELQASWGSTNDKCTTHIVWGLHRRRAVVCQVLASILSSNDSLLLSGFVPPTLQDVLLGRVTKQIRPLQVQDGRRVTGLTRLCVMAVDECWEWMQVSGIYYLQSSQQTYTICLMDTNEDWSQWWSNNVSLVATATGASEIHMLQELLHHCQETQVDVQVTYGTSMSSSSSPQGSSIVCLNHGNLSHVLSPLFVQAPCLLSAVAISNGQMRDVLLQQVTPQVRSLSWKEGRIDGLTQLSVNTVEEALEWMKEPALYYLQNDGITTTTVTLLPDTATHPWTTLQQSLQRQVCGSTVLLCRMDGWKETASLLEWAQRLDQEAADDRLLLGDTEQDEISWALLNQSLESTQEMPRLSGGNTKALAPLEANTMKKKQPSIRKAKSKREISLAPVDEDAVSKPVDTSIHWVPEVDAQAASTKLWKHLAEARHTTAANNNVSMNALNGSKDYGHIIEEIQDEEEQDEPKDEAPERVTSSTKDMGKQPTKRSMSLHQIFRDDHRKRSDEIQSETLRQLLQCNLQLVQENEALKSQIPYEDKTFDDMSSCALSLASMTSSISNVDFFLPNPTTNTDLTTSEYLQLDNIFRPWQAEFLYAIAILDAHDFVEKADTKQHRRELAQGLQRWRQDQGLVLMNAQACQTALTIWYRTCRQIVTKHCPTPVRAPRRTEFLDYKVLQEGSLDWDSARVI